MNFFLYKTVAERYIRHRPYFHPLVMEKVSSRLDLQQPVSLALDVGCGPGQSALALKEIANFVLGVDVSAEMLAVARKISGVQYLQGPAEVLPVQDRCIDLLTTFLAFHWFDQDRFLAEARRVLKDDAWLIISNNGFSGQMGQSPEFETWMAEVFLERYPTPPRNSTPLTEKTAGQYGFRFAYREEYQNEIEFSAEEVSAYLTTQSNVVAATEQGRENVEHVHRWLTEQIRPFFKTDKAQFPFGGYIWYLQNK
jgi:ubiquinone/menaquinone biosynthesis C-methylase UbiE